MSGAGWRAVSAARVRHTIATAMLGGESDAGPRKLGDVELLPHQLQAVRRLRASLRDHGGALLADSTGLGKTYVALALARESRCALIVAPAALREMWRKACTRAGVELPFTSMEQLSRAHIQGMDADFVIVDEAHHARNPATSRYRHLARLTAGARVLLLSATPLHNRPGDLVALLALFLGSQAIALHPAILAQCIVRRSHGEAGVAALLPEASAPEELPASGDPNVLDELLALPPPLPPSDSGDGGALLTLSLVRQWSSSDGALRAALRRRLARAIALEAALAAGRYPGAADLRLWNSGDDSVQLAFAELLAPSGSATQELLAAVRQHARAVSELLRTRLAGSDRDAGSARQLRQLRQRHDSEKIVAFSHSADTVTALWRELRNDPGVAALTGAGAVIASGPLSRESAIARFAPAAAGARSPPAAEQIQFLLTSDVLSEGINLQDASVVIHLDLPWTPARLAQRLGRVRRLGSRHKIVSSYLCTPPAPAERLLGVERVLRAKARAARRLVGDESAAMPWLGEGNAEHSSPEVGTAFRKLLDEWLTTARPMTIASDPRGTSEALGDPHATNTHYDAESSCDIAAVTASHEGFLALVQIGDQRLLVAVLRDVTGDDPAHLLEAARLARGSEIAVDVGRLAHAFDEVGRWLRSRVARLSLRLDDPRTMRLRRRLLESVSAIVTAAPLHRRAEVALLACRARQAIAGRHSVGVEARLRELLAEESRDDGWLGVVARTCYTGEGETDDRYIAQASRAAPGEIDTAFRVRALMLLQPATLFTHPES